MCATPIILPFLASLALGGGIVWCWLEGSSQPTRQIPAWRQPLHETAVAQSAAAPATWERWLGAPSAQRLSIMAGLLSEVTPEGIPVLAVNFLTALPPPAECEWLMMFRRWVEVDPVAALVFAREHETKPPERVQWAAIAWAELSPEAALAAVHDASHVVQSAVIQSVIPRDPHWAWKANNTLPKADRLEGTEFIGVFQALDPAVAAAFVEELRANDQGLDKIAEAYFACAPEAALAWARQLPGNDGQGAYAGLLVKLAGADLERAAALLGEAPGHGPFLHVASEIAASMAKQDPAAARAWVHAHYQEPTRQFALYGAIKGLTEKDPLAALQLLNEIGWEPLVDRVHRQSSYDQMPTANDPRMITSNLLKKLAHEHPQEALQSIAAAQKFKYDEATTPAMGAWIKQDPAGLLAWVKTEMSVKAGFQEDMDREEAFSKGLAAHWPSSDFATLVRELNTDELSKSHLGEVARIMTRNLTAKDSREGEQFIAGLPSQFQDEARLAWVTELSAVRPLEALEAFWRTPELFQKIALADPFASPMPATRLAEKHAQATADALRAHADVNGVELLTRPFVAEWAGLEPEAASAWINQLPQSALRDASVEGLLTVLRGSDSPDYVAIGAWTDSIQDAEKHYDLCLMAYEVASGKVAPNLAQDFLNSLRLTPEERKLIESRENPPDLSATDPFAK